MIFRRLAFSAALLLLPGVARHPAAAYALTFETAVPPRQQILSPPPLRLDWSSPDRTVWITGEGPAPRQDASGTVVSAQGWGSAGARHQLFRRWGVSLATVPLIRSVALWQEQQARSRQAFGAALVQELTIALPAGFHLRAKGGIGQRAGLSDTDWQGASYGYALRGEAAISASLALIGQPETRFDLQVISLRRYGIEGGEPRPPAACELKLELARDPAPPLRLGGSCPGAAGAARVTLSIGGWF